MINIANRLRYDDDTTTIRLRRIAHLLPIRRKQKMNMSIFRRSTSTPRPSYRSRIIVESQLWYRLKQKQVILDAFC